MMKTNASGNNNEYTLGYDYYKYWYTGERIQIRTPVQHTICIGSTNSGKTTGILYWLYQIKCNSISCDIYIVDFKKSHEYEGITQPEKYAEFEEGYELIIRFYDMFQQLPEGGDGRYKILLIDEIAGMLSHFSLTKEGKQKADAIRIVMSTIMMTGRSRKTSIFLSMQRFSTNLFPASSGAADNAGTIIGLGRLSVDSRRSLFAREHFDGEEALIYGQGKGIVLIDEEPLRSLIIPRVSKEKILNELRR